MNIWSHLIGFICVVVVGIQISADFFSNTDNFYHVVALETYIACASICLLLSSIYHWFGCLSEDHHDNLLKMDLTGVALLIAGSFFAAVYYGFYCTPSDQIIHLCLTGLVLVIGLSAPWIEFEIGGRCIRPFIFMSLVVLGLVPFVHWVMITPSIFRDELVMGFIWIFFWYGMGFTMYISRLPEKLFPNNFFATHIIPSHTLWHICVLNAVYVCFHFLIKYRDLLGEKGCSAYNLDSLVTDSISTTAAVVAITTCAVSHTIIDGICNATTATLTNIQYGE
jgi:adiponectin receptor